MDIVMPDVTPYLDRDGNKKQYLLNLAKVVNNDRPQRALK